MAAHRPPPIPIGIFSACGRGRCLLRPFKRPRGVAVLVVLALSLADSGAKSIAFARPVTTTPAAPAAALLAKPLDRVPLAQMPHPAVARVVAQERGAESHGSGTLVDVREDCGLVITNWHVIRDAVGDITVRFPNGFTSPARVRKVDKDWDLAALVIWRPPIEPVSIARLTPRRGDLLTIAGYGPGPYRAATGRCIQYVSPGIRFPPEMVELSVEARQGDSGGPIFNERGELAGVLFGAAQGTTTGSYCGRVRTFLTSIVPNPGSFPASDKASAVAQQPTAPGATPVPPQSAPSASTYATPNQTPATTVIPDPAAHALAPVPVLTPQESTSTPANSAAFSRDMSTSVSAQPPPAAGRDEDGWTAPTFPARDRTTAVRPASAETAPTLEQLLGFDGSPWDKAKTVFALIGVLSVVLQLGKFLNASNDES